MSISRSQLIKTAISLSLLLSVIFLVPFREVADSIIRFDGLTVFIAFSLIFASILLSSVRMKSLLGGFEISAPFQNVHHLNVLSQLAGYFFFSTFGQMMFRSSVGASYLNKSHRLALLTLIEKIMSLVTLLFLSIGGAWIISRSVNLISTSTAYLGVIALSSVIAFGLGYVVVLSPGQRQYCRRFLRYMFIPGMSVATVTSLVMHLLMLSAYIVLARSLIPDVNVLNLAAVFSLVMLGAAIPISFAGWGIRELSAGFAFSIIGYEPSIGISVAVVIGGISLLALITHGLLSQFLKGVFQGTQSQEGAQPVGDSANFHLERLLVFVAGLILPITIGIQLRIPTDTHLLTINLADPTAIMMGITFLALWGQHLRHQAIWRVPGLPLAVTSFVVLIGYGLLIGIIQYGGNHWAEFNRGIGVLILLAYLFCGTFLTTQLSKRYVLLFSRFLLTAFLICYLFYIVLFPFLDASSLEFLVWHGRHFNGFMGNRNALSLIVLLCLCVVLGFAAKKARPFDILMIGSGVFLTIASSSRTGFICLGIALAITILSRRTSFKTMAYASGCVLLLMLLSSVINGLIACSLGGCAAFFSSDGVGLLRASPLPADFGSSSALSASFADRLLGYQYGLSMWLEHPIFGAGLGAFIEEYQDIIISPTIHNSVLWILAETGLVGFAMLLPLPIVLLKHTLREPFTKLSPQDFSLMLILVVVILFSQPHEMLYQRIIWIMIGMLAGQKLTMGRPNLSTTP